MNMVDTSINNVNTYKKVWKGIALDIWDCPKRQMKDITSFTFNPCTILNRDDAHEGYLYAYNELDFLLYKYRKIHKFNPDVYKFSDVDINRLLIDLFKQFDIQANAYTYVTYQTFAVCRVTTLVMRIDEFTYLYVYDDVQGIIIYKPGTESNPDSTVNLFLGIMQNYISAKVENNKIFIVYRGPDGFEKKGFDISKFKVDIDENYNDDFKEVSEQIINGLNSKDKTNLVILNGAPGTGKTSYIRYLAGKLKKNIIFISPDMVNSIADPSFIPFLIDNNNSILIIEDAEPALEKREHAGRSSAVSNVLNLTDGLLSDCLNISIVATFNTSDNMIDDALLRKGRLLMNYKFDKLSVQKSKALLSKLGHTVDVKEPMSLADIYYYGVDNNKNKSHKSLIGFK